MATIQVPKIDRIYRVTEFDMLRTAIQKNSMYLCVDSLKMYYDSGVTEDSRGAFNYVSVGTINELLKEITPDYGKIYYVWEDNSMWVWLNKWEALYSQTTYPSAYSYADIPSITNKQVIDEIYRYDMPNMPADDNGLLKDGSVVVRDRNRLIKGKIYIEDSNDNLIISSFLGGGLRLLPNGRMSTDGELLLDKRQVLGGDPIPTAVFRAEVTALNQEMYVDYSDNPLKDNNEYQNTTHRYKVFHEGNLDTSAIKIMTPQQIYDKLLDESLPQPFDFNVAYLNGKSASEFALASHKHVATDITDLDVRVTQLSGMAVRNIFTNMSGEGISAVYNPATEILTMSANSFRLTLSGGVSGSATIDKLTDTNIEVSVDPTKHSHTNYETTLTSLQNQINSISYDINTTYTKNVIDQMISDVTPTTIPTQGKALVVNNQGILPVTSSNAKQLNHYIELNLTGDITGTTQFNGSETILNIATTLNTSGGIIDNAVESKIASMKYIQSIGDGISTQFTIQHNLNSQNIMVQFRDTATNKQVYLDNTIIDNNVIQVNASTVLALGQVKILVWKIA